MHRHHRHGHHHGHDHHDDHDHHHGHDHHHPPHGPGHNNPHSDRTPVQWQAPHQPDTEKRSAPAVEPDLDKVEAAFVDGFLGAPDPISFLRLARVPFEMTADGASLRLLRVEIDALTDVGSLTPHLGGGTFRYDPLPSNFVSRRRRLRFVYFDGTSLRGLSYAELREIESGG
jgi:hypothetical protein